MKKLYILITFLFLTSSYLSAQVDVVTGVINPARILLNGNDLYIAESGSVSKIDITAPLPTTAASVVTGLSTSYGLYISGNDLFIIDFNGIYKKDITTGAEAVGALVTVASITDGGDLALNINDGFLYFSEYGGGQISRVDITGAFPATPEVVVDGLFGPTGIVFNNDILYIAQYDNNDLLKIDISGGVFPITAVSGDQVVAGVDAIDGLFLNGTTLYMTSSINVSTIDIMAPVPVASVVVPVQSADIELSANGNDLYIAEINANKISKMVLSTLAVEQYNVSLSIAMYPNPSSDFIKIAGLTNTANYEITNMLGGKVQAGKVSQNEDINVRSLNKGVYFVKLENGASLKFLKN